MRYRAELLGYAVLTLTLQFNGDYYAYTHILTYFSLYIYVLHARDFIYIHIYTPLFILSIKSCVLFVGKTHTHTRVYYSLSLSALLFFPSLPFVRSCILPDVWRVYAGKVGQATLRHSSPGPFNTLSLSVSFTNFELQSGLAIVCLLILNRFFFLLFFWHQ